MFRRLKKKSKASLNGGGWTFLVSVHLTHNDKEPLAKFSIHWKLFNSQIGINCRSSVEFVTTNQNKRTVLFFKSKFTIIQTFNEKTSLFSLTNMWQKLLFPTMCVTFFVLFWCSSLTFELPRGLTRTNVPLQFQPVLLTKKNSFCLVRPHEQNIWVVLCGIWDLSLSNGGGWLIADADEITTCLVHAQELIRQAAKKKKRPNQSEGDSLN